MLDRRSYGATRMTSSLLCEGGGWVEPLAVWAEVDDEDVLRLRIAEPRSIAVGGRLALRRRQARDEDFRLAPLGPDPERVTIDLAGLQLTEGRWDVYLLAAGEVGRGARMRCTDPGHTLDGLLEYARPRRRFALRAYRTVLDGHLAVHVLASPPHAELQVLTLTDDELVVEGVLAYAGVESAGRRRDARLVAVLHGAGHETVGTAAVDGRRFSGRLPLSGLAAVADRGDWDLWLQLEADTGQDGVPGRLRVSSRLDGIADKAARIRYPARCVHRGSDRVSVRPCHARGSGDLAIAVQLGAEDSDQK